MIRPELNTWDETRQNQAMHAEHAIGRFPMEAFLARAG